MTGYDTEGVARWVLLELLLSSGNIEQTAQNKSHCLYGFHFMLLGGVLSYADIPQEHYVNTRENHLRRGVRNHNILPSLDDPRKRHNLI